MTESLPDVEALGPEDLVLQLLEEVAALRAENAALREEIARLKGLKGPPKIKPSGMDRATDPKPGGRKRKRRGRGSKLSRSTIDEECIVKADVPDGSRFKGYEDYVVQDLILRPAQQVAAFPFARLRIGSLLPTEGHRPWLQTEEARPRPLRSRNLPRNCGERATAFAVPFEPVLQHQNRVRFATPFTDQPQARLHADRRASGQVPVLPEVLDDARQLALLGRRQAAMDFLLELPGDRQDQQIPPDMQWWVRAVEPPPFRPQGDRVEIGQRGELLGQAIGGRRVSLASTV